MAVKSLTSSPSCFSSSSVGSSSTDGIVDGAFGGGGGDGDGVSRTKWNSKSLSDDLAVSAIDSYKIQNK